MHHARSVGNTSHALRQLGPGNRATPNSLFVGPGDKCLSCQAKWRKRLVAGQHCMLVPGNFPCEAKKHVHSCLRVEAITGSRNSRTTPEQGRRQILHPGSVTHLLSWIILRNSWIMAELIRLLTSKVIKVDRSVLKRTLSSSRTVVLSKAWSGPGGGVKASSTVRRDTTSLP